MCVVGLLFGWISDCTINSGRPVARIRKIFNSIGCWGPASILVAIACFEHHIPEREKSVVLNVALSAAIILLAGNHAGAMVGALDISPRYAGSLVSLITLISPIFALNATDLWSFFLFHMASVSKFMVWFLGKDFLNSDKIKFHNEIIFSIIGSS